MNRQDLIAEVKENIQIQKTNHPDSVEHKTAVERNRELFPKLEGFNIHPSEVLEA